jgi:hypothetical protein
VGIGTSGRETKLVASTDGAAVDRPSRPPKGGQASWRMGGRLLLVRDVGPISKADKSTRAAAEGAGTWKGHLDAHHFAEAAAAPRPPAGKHVSAFWGCARGAEAYQEGRRPNVRPTVAANEA